MALPHAIPRFPRARERYSFLPFLRCLRRGPNPWRNCRALVGGSFDPGGSPVQIGFAPFGQKGVIYWGVKYQKWKRGSDSAQLLCVMSIIYAAVAKELGGI
jgi:hypothetical protein